MKSMTKEERKEYNILYNIKNKEKLKKHRIKYRLDTKEEEAETRKKYRQKNKEKIKKDSAEYRLNNKEKIKTNQAEYRLKNKQKCEYNNANRIYGNKEKETAKKYKIKNRDKVRKYQNNYIKKRYSSDSSFKITKNIRTRLLFVLKTNKKLRRTIDFLGCSLDEFKKYFESKFTEGMNWEKYINSEIHIDHIIPCDAFDLTKEEALEFCFNYSNLQPMWKIDNIKKSNKIDIDYLKSINIKNIDILKEKYRKLII